MDEPDAQRSQTFAVEVGFSGANESQRRAFALRLMEENARARGLRVDPDSMREYKVTGDPDRRTWRAKAYPA